MTDVIVLCPAKINLFLNITGKQDDMHLLKMVNQTVSLYDTLYIKLNGTGRINITCNNKNIPLDENNSCYKAASLMKDTFNIKFGFDIEITKKIPTGAGLGGESTDAAGVVLGISHMFKLNIDSERL